MKQTSLFGLDEDISNIQPMKKQKSVPTIKNRFRRFAGYDRTRTCKNCKFHEIQQFSRPYHKCLKMGITSSSATDIRVSDPACKFYEEAKEPYMMVERRNDGKSTNEV